MLTDDKITEIFVMADEFCKVFNAMLRRRGLCASREGRKRDYHRDCRILPFSKEADDQSRKGTR